MLMFDYFQRGGPVMYVLLGCSILGLAIFIKKIVYLMYHKIDEKSLINETKKKLTTVGLVSTITDLQLDNNIVTRVSAYALGLTELPLNEIPEALKASTLAELPKLEKDMSILSVLITICPMLGLLGTILGLMDIFQVLSTGASLGTSQWDPTLLSRGISTALITTAAGLGIAIPLMLLYQYLMQLIERYVMQMERVVQDLVNFCKTSEEIQP